MNRKNIRVLEAPEHPNDEDGAKAKLVATRRKQLPFVVADLGTRGKVHLSARLIETYCRSKGWRSTSTKHTIAKRELAEEVYIRHNDGMWFAVRSNNVPQCEVIFPALGFAMHFACANGEVVADTVEFFAYE